MYIKWFQWKYLFSEQTWMQRSIMHRLMESLRFAGKMDECWQGVAEYSNPEAPRPLAFVLVPTITAKSAALLRREV